MRAPAVLGALLLAAALAPPGAGDAHNARWRGSGALAGAAGALLVEAEWHGTCIQAYTVTLRDPATGALVEQRTFPGAQAVTDTPGPPTLPDVFLLAGESRDPTVPFQVHGAQVVGHHALPYLSQGLTGTYRGAPFALATVLAAWSLC